MSEALQPLIQSRLSQVDTSDLLHRLGYAPDNQRALERLMLTVESDDYGLRQSRFDFRYSGADFLRALCRQLDIAPEPVEAEIRRVQDSLREETMAYRPFIWIDTHFRRASQPLFALAACESQRHIGLDWRLAAKAPWEEQLRQVRARIARHWQETQGELGIWGQVQEYWYFYAEGQAVRLKPTGELIESHQGSVPSRASLSL
ncbi:MAG: hypothetical protein LAT62_13775 [Natronospirillum sp.]|uniref:hypothetical protein n=1 Tax=Natronospirillum sp. TaxID=2812955 RepID=UPI0025D2CD31|nr:hypothetical protein [Natronospirillum sp.]MCH8553001.1 hypothetical protein [Natronospirillum sp.]